MALLCKDIFQITLFYTVLLSSCNYIYLPDQNSTCDGIICPRGPFQLDTCVYNSFINNISFGYFCNDTGDGWLAYKRTFSQTECKGAYTEGDAIPCDGMDDKCNCHSRKPDNCVHTEITIKYTNPNDTDGTATCLDAKNEFISYVSQVCVEGLGVVCVENKGLRFDRFEEDDEFCEIPTKVIEGAEDFNVVLPDECVSIECPTPVKSEWGALGLALYVLIMGIVLLASQSGSLH